MIDELRKLEAWRNRAATDRNWSRGSEVDELGRIIDSLIRQQAGGVDRHAALTEPDSMRAARAAAPTQPPAPQPEFTASMYGSPEARWQQLLLDAKRAGSRAQNSYYRAGWADAINFIASKDNGNGG